MPGEVEQHNHRSDLCQASFPRPGAANWRFHARVEAEALASEAGVTLIDPQLSEKGRARMNVLSLLLLIVGVLAGAAGAAALLRRNRERMSDELKAISLDVLQRTGDSLAQRVADARRAEEERAAGEIAKRAEEIKGLVGPVQEKLGRMETEIGGAGGGGGPGQ